MLTKEREPRRLVRTMPLVGALLMRMALATPASSQGLDGYYYVPPPPLPDSLREVRAGGRFTISIVRTATDDFARELHRQAEGLFPPRSLIESATVGVRGSGHIRALAEAASEPGNRWWWRDWDDVWLPFALTGAAVDHYVKRVRELSAQPNPFEEWNPGVEHRASVEYTARVIRPASSLDAAPFEVHLEVQFWFYCGRLCALSFTHSRRIQFDESGTVLGVSGDVRPSYVVS